MEVPGKRKEPPKVISEDEEPGRGNTDKIPSLRPVCFAFLSSAAGLVSLAMFDLQVLRLIRRRFARRGVL